MKVWMPLISTGTGAEVYSEQLAAGLRELGHDVQLDKARHGFQYAPWLAGLRPRRGTDVTLANSWNAAAFARYAPLVTIVHHVVHDPSLNRQKSLAQRVFHASFVRPMERAALRRSQRVIAVSKRTAAAIQEFLLPAPVDVVLNGVDTDYFCPESMPVRPPFAPPLKLLYVGKISRRKGFDLVAEIMASLGDRASLTIIGGDPEPGLEIPDALNLGRVDKAALRSAYRQADFLIFPSRLEGFGLVAAEAMACGLPVLCISGGAVEEVVQPPLAGVSVHLERAHELGEIALGIAGDQQQHDLMRVAARRRAVEKLGSKRWINESEAVLLAAAGQKPS